VIRLLALSVVVLALSVYAWRDWYKALCGLILLIAVVEHPDMPKTLFGIQGLNLWNMLLSVVLLAWLSSRRRERLAWDMPRHVTWLLLVYFGVVLVGFLRMMADRAGLEGETTGFLISEYLINTVKWVVPGLLLYDGCRSRKRFILGLCALTGVYVLLAIQVIRWMPIETAFSGDSLTARSLKILSNEVGFHRVNLAMMLAGGSWAVLATLPLARRWTTAMAISGAGLVTIYALALTAGRMGYMAWAVVGLALGVLRWRRYLVIVPLIAMLGAWAVPGTLDRMGQGFEEDVADVYTVTAGRNMAWPLVLDKIAEAPLGGYGRRGMERTGIAALLRDEFDEDFAHPHNAYLEMLLDNGWIGLLLVAPFYLTILGMAVRLLRDQRSPYFVVAGAVTTTLVLALLVASVGSQTFYPREGAVPMWCAIGLALRIAVVRARLPARARRTSLDRGFAPAPSGWRVGRNSLRPAGSTLPPLAVTNRGEGVPES
jgi:O-antigen ligase